MLATLSGLTRAGGAPVVRKSVRHPGQNRAKNRDSRLYSDKNGPQGQANESLNRIQYYSTMNYNHYSKSLSDRLCKSDYTGCANKWPRQTIQPKMKK